MIEKILQKLLFGIVMDRMEKKDKKFIENCEEETLEEGVVFKGREYQYFENLAAAARMAGSSPYQRYLQSYTLHYDDYIYLNNYKKEGVKLTYQQLAECKRNGKTKYNKGRGMVLIKLENKQKYWMFVCGSDKDREKEPEITRQIAAFLQQKCGTTIV